MIDWWMVARNAVWITGAAIVVASWSFKRTLASPLVFLGTVMFCAGMAASSRWWEAALWLAVPVVWRWKGA